MSLEVLVADLKRHKEEFQQKAEAAIVDYLKGFFERLPQVHSIQWKQYTPYFNDGDPCTFRLGNVNALLIANPDTAKEPDEEDEDYDEDEDEDYENRSDTLSSWSDKYPQVAAELKKIDELFGEIEDQIEQIFGEHVKVTVFRDGNTQIEEYEHD